MAQFAADDFAGSEGTLLSTYNSAWTRHTSYSVGCEIAAGRVRCSSDGVSAYYHSGSPASADYSVACDLFFKQTDGGLGGAGVVARMSTSGNTHYHARYYGSTFDAYQLYRYNSGTATLLGSYATGVADEATRALVLAVSGSATVDLSVTVDGTERIATSDSSGSRITDAGKAGIRLLPGTTPSDDNAIHIDNFSADDLGGSAPTLSDLKAASITSTTVQGTYDYVF